MRHRLCAAILAAAVRSGLGQRRDDPGDVINTRVRGFALLLAVLSLVGGGTAGAVARPLAHVHELRPAAKRPWSIGVAPAPCEDRAYRFIGAKWHKPYRWSFAVYTTPKSLSAPTVKAVLLKSFANLTGGRNDCGLSDRIGATAQFVGESKLHPNCMEPDGHNVVGFGRLQFGVLAVTCYWFNGGRMVEADIKINSREAWALSLSGCRNRAMLEATITHEAGHVFGLDHIGEKRHGRLTMSPFLDGPCENEEATLGLGDILGLEALY